MAKSHWLYIKQTQERWRKSKASNLLSAVDTTKEDSKLKT